jgi:hypothetical protein
MKLFGYALYVNQLTENSKMKKALLILTASAILTQSSVEAVVKVLPGGVYIVDQSGVSVDIGVDE